jgi:hypothetical protein
MVYLTFLTQGERLLSKFLYIIWSKGTELIVCVNKTQVNLVRRAFKLQPWCILKIFFYEKVSTLMSAVAVCCSRGYLV